MGRKLPGKTVGHSACYAVRSGTGRQRQRARRAGAKGVWVWVWMRVGGTCTSLQARTVLVGLFGRVGTPSFSLGRILDGRRVGGMASGTHGPQDKTLFRILAPGFLTSPAIQKAAAKTDTHTHRAGLPKGKKTGRKICWSRSSCYPSDTRGAPIYTFPQSPSRSSPSLPSSSPPSLQTKVPTHNVSQGVPRPPTIDFPTNHLTPFAAFATTPHSPTSFDAKC